MFPRDCIYSYQRLSCTDKYCVLLGVRFNAASASVVPHCQVPLRDERAARAGATLQPGAGVAAVPYGSVQPVPSPLGYCLWRGDLPLVLRV